MQVTTKTIDIVVMQLITNRMASFGYTINEIVCVHTDFALKSNNASASTRIHQDIKGAAYKGLVESSPGVRQLGL